MSQTIDCGNCGAHMRLSSQLLARIVGKTGKITCKVCDVRLRLDCRQGSVLVSVDGAAGSPGSAAAMLSVPTASARPIDGPDVAPTIEIAGDALESIRPGTGRPGSAARSHDPAVPSLHELARQSRGPALEPLPLVQRREEALPLVNRREALPLVQRRVSSIPFAYEDRRTTEGSISPYTLDSEDTALTHLGTTDDSSPYSASLRDEEIDKLYAHVGPVRSSRAPRSPSLPAARSLGPKNSSLPAPPPRPWELAERSPVSSGPAPFERFGLSSAPPLPTAVVLTPDGRLINASDRPVPPRRNRRALVAVPFAAALAVALSAAAAQPEVRGLLGLHRPTPAAREIVLADETANVREAAQPPAPSLALEPSVAEEPSLAERATPDATVLADVAVESAATPAATPAAKASRKAAPDSTASPSTTDAGTDAAGAAELTAAEPSEESLPEFSTSAAAVALNEATAHAAACRKPGDPSGIARVVVTFAPSGRATSATLSGPPFTGTETGSCIASRFRGARVPAFSGDFQTVTKTVTVQ